LPAKTCILSLDSMTDIRKAKDVLGDHMCIMGDVPPALLSSGTPDQVYAHCSKLVADIGPTGYILQSGCDIPVDAPLANVKAMADAAADV
jgi:uroporphyrinogen-III decarboxylase